MNFFRGWQAYRDGFGKLTGEHWLGEMAEPAPGGTLSPCAAWTQGALPGRGGPVWLTAAAVDAFSVNEVS